MLEVFYGSSAYKNIFERRSFPFVAATQLVKFLCSKFHESGILSWVGENFFVVSVMCILPIGVVVFIALRVLKN